MELVHHHGADPVEVELLAVQQPVGQYLGHDHQDPRVGVFAAVAGHEADVGGLEAPLDGQLLHLAELLLGQGNQRGGVVGHLAGVQRLEQRGLGDERLAHARRRADQHPLLGREPAQQGLFLKRIRVVRDLVEVGRAQVVAGGGVGGHGLSQGMVDYPMVTYSEPPQRRLPVISPG